MTEHKRFRWALFVLLFHCACALAQASTNTLSISLAVTTSVPYQPFTTFNATYYADGGFGTVVTTRTDAAINFDWCTNPLPPGTNATFFSARWQANVWLDPTTYTFTISNVKNYGNLYLDGIPVIQTPDSVDTSSTTNITGRVRNMIVEYSKPNGGVCPTNGPRITFSYTPVIKNSNLYVYQSQTQSFLQLYLSVDQGSVTVSNLKIKGTGTSPQNDVYQAQIFLDSDGNGSLETGADTLLGATSLTSQGGGVYAANISLSPQVVVFATSPVTLFAAYRINSNATPNDTIGMAIQDITYVSISSNQPVNTQISTTTLPIFSSSFTIQNTVSNLYQISTDISSGTVIQNDPKYTLLEVGLWSNNFENWTGINLKRTGNASDSDISSMKVYKYADQVTLVSGHHVAGSGDSLISSGQDVFSGGFSSITLTTPQSINNPVIPAVQPYTTQYYYIAATMNPFATVGSSVGITLASTQAFTVDGTNQVANSGYPVGTILSTIQHYPDIVTITSSASLIPSGINQSQTNVPVMMLSLKTGVSNSSWTQLMVKSTGSVQDSDISQIKVFNDSLGTQIFTPSLDTLVSTGNNVFTSGSCNIQISSQTILPGQATYFISVDISSFAFPGHTFALYIASSSNFTVSSPNKMSPALLPSSTTIASVIKPPSTLVVTGVSAAPLTANQSQTLVPMLKLQMTLDRYTSQLLGVQVDRTGNTKDSDVSQVRLFTDNAGTGVFDPVRDQPFANGQFNQGSVLLTFSSQSLTSASSFTCFVVYDISQSASSGLWLGAKIANSNYFTVSAGDIVSNSGFPVTSSSMTLVAVANGLNFSGTDRNPSFVAQSSTASCFLNLTLSATGNVVPWTGLTVVKTGNLSDGDVKAVRVFRDVNGIGYFNSAWISSYTEVTSGGNGFIVGQSNVQFPSAVWVSTAASKFFLCLDLTNTARVGNTVGLSITSYTAVSVSPPNVVINSGFPIASSLATVTDMGHAVIVATASIPIPAAYQGSKSVPLLKFYLNANEYLANWTALRVDKLGNLSDVSVDAVKLYQDTNGNGVLDASTDTLVATVLFSGGVAQFGFNPQTLVSAASTYFLAVDINANSPAGATIGLKIGNANYLTVGSPDYVSPFNAISSTLCTVIDARTPTTPVITPSSSYISSFDTLGFGWQSSVLSGTIGGAVYAIGVTPFFSSTSPIDTSVRSWTALTPSQTAVTASGLSLQVGPQYYVFVQAQSSFGIWSSTGVSGPIALDIAKPQVTAPPQATVSANSFTLSWAVSVSPVSGVSGFIVEEKPGDRPNFRTFNPGAQPSGAKVFGVPYEGAVAQAVSTNKVVISGKSGGTYSYRVRPMSGSGVLGDPSPSTRVDFNVSGLSPVSLISNFPNPFDSRKQKTTITYTLNSDNPVSIRIYDAFGGLVRNLNFDAGSQGGSSGANQIQWDGTDNGGSSVAMGVYYAIVDPANNNAASGSQKPLVIGVVH